MFDTLCVIVLAGNIRLRPCVTSLRFGEAPLRVAKRREALSILDTALHVGADTLPHGQQTRIARGPYQGEANAIRGPALGVIIVEQ